MPTPKFEPDQLSTLAILEGLPSDHIAWLAAHADRVDLAQGDRLVSRGQASEFMFLVVAGLIQRYEEIGGQWLIVAATRRGEVTGMLPFSRMTQYPGHMVAAETTKVLRLRQSDFVEMLTVSAELGRRLVGRMSDRVRGDVRLEQQREKMMSLGRLAAGLAHELNNPAAAAGRAAAALAAELTALRTVTASLAQHGLDAKALEAVDALTRLARTREAPRLSAVDRSELEEEIFTWLDEHAVPQAGDIASVFVDVGLGVEALADFAATVPAPIVADALAWVGCHLVADRLAGEIVSSTGRISELVASVKTYSHMDRSAEHKPTDVLEGLDNTLVMLGHRVGAGDVRLVREYATDLPLIEANAGELNQVWTNLIDNALDALEQGGELRIEVRRDGPWIRVDIIDNGPGIPDEVRGHIFEPFFTTKGVGEGTGLGLDIALRIVTIHQGQIVVQSRPGRTEVCVRLPVSASALDVMAAKPAAD